MFNYFTRIIKVNGQEKKYHAYWFTDKTGRRVQKLCKNPDGRRCTSKKNALDYIEQLERAYAAEQKKQPIPFFDEYAARMFLPDSFHLARKEEHDRAIKEKTRRAHRSHIVQVLIPLFGHYRITEIDSRLVDDNLIGLKKENGEKYSGSFKNGLLYTLNIILREAKRDGFITHTPDFEVFARKSRRQDILSDMELTRLFPDSLEEINAVWKPARPDTREQKHTALMLCVISGIAVSAGLRSGEVRALQMDQLYPQYNGLIIDRAFDSKNDLDSFLKTGNESDPRHRVVVIPDKTWNLLDMYLKVRGYHDGFVFEYFNKPLTQSFLQHRFALALKTAGLDLTNRKTTFHALRYTYNTKMRRLLDAETLRDFIGHRNEAMTDHYDRPILEQLLQQHHGKQQVVNQFWKVG